MGGKNIRMRSSMRIFLPYIFLPYIFLPAFFAVPLDSVSCPGEPLDWPTNVLQYDPQA